MSDDCLICKDCETWHQSYSHLKHYDSTSGGFCTTCGSPDLIAESEMDDDQKDFYFGSNTCSIAYDDSAS